VEVTGIGPSTSACISPATSLARGFLALMGGRGRPNLTPRSWARFRPSPVQALSLRSNSAQPAVKREAKEDWELDLSAEEAAKFLKMRR